MLISTETGSYEKFGNNFEIIKMLKNAGFEAFDYSMHGRRKNVFLDDENYLERAKELRRFADSAGILCNQTHAPFPTVKPKDEEFNGRMLPRLKRAIEITAVLGGRVCVIHPCNFYDCSQNAEFYAKLLPTAKSCGVIICAENMWNWNAEIEKACYAACCEPKDFCGTIKAVNSPYLKACLDIGHAEMDGLGTTAEEMILALDKNLAALHIHDNDLRHDNHALPFTMQIDFDKVIATLKRVGYSGDITFEADTVAPKMPKALIPAMAKFLASIGKYIRAEILNGK